MNKKLRGIMSAPTKGKGGKASQMMAEMGGVVGPQKNASKAKQKPPIKAPIKNMY